MTDAPRPDPHVESPQAGAPRPDIAAAPRVVVKVGSSSLTTPDGEIDGAQALVVFGDRAEAGHEHHGDVVAQAVLQQ